MLVRMLAVLLLVHLGAQASLAAGRVALVMGVGDYDNAVELDNPTRDAEAVASALTLAGFDVLLSLNTDQRNFGQMLLDFSNKTKGADAAVFYFAGHGIQINSKNYLLSKDAEVRNPLLIEQDGFELGKILDLMSRNAKTSIAIIDACRDNPLANSLFAQSAPGTRSVWGLSRGLARMDTEFSNSLVAFATSPGSVAYDGSDEHSPFTNALLNHISAPGVEISVLLKRVTSDVLKETKGAQRPEVVASMAQEFYFFDPEITVQGDVLVAPSSDPEATATQLLRIAMNLPEGEKRDASLRLVVSRFEGTAAADIAEQFLSAQRAAKDAAAKAAEEAEKAKRFDPSILDGLDVSRDDAGRARDRTFDPNSPESREASLNLSRNDIVKIQRGLNTMGYNLGAVDGNFGPRSRSALRSFQVFSQIPQTGFLDQRTIDVLLKAVAKVPNSYQGSWSLIIYREWLRDDRNHAPNKRGTREILVSARVEARGNRFYIQSFTYRTIEPSQPFSDFDMTYTDGGRVTVNGGVSTMFRDANHVVPAMRRLSARFQLPELVPISKSVEAGGNTIDGNLKFHVKLTRID